MLFLYFLVIAFGLTIGSFLNALIWRMHSGESMWTRSHCLKCKKGIAWYDNIPVLSYLWLGGRCRHCRKRISWQYPAVESVTAILFFLAFYGFNFSVNSFEFLSILNLLKYWFVIAVMVVVFVYDLRWYLILDKVTFSASLLLFLLLIFELFASGKIGDLKQWQAFFLSVIIGVGFFWLQFVVSRGRWIGGGDVKLGLVMALAIGWPNILAAIFMAYISGSIVGLGLVAAGKKELGSKLPFGVFLSVATVVMLLWGEPIINWYLKMMGF